MNGRGLSGASDEIVSYRAANRQLTITRDGHSENRTQTLLPITSMKRCRVNHSDSGGYVGYFGYELRSDCDSPVTHASPFPDAMLMRVEDKPEPLVALCGVAGNTSLPKPRLSRSEYLDRIRECIRHIRDGEAYELCLTNQLEFESDFPALQYYETLRRLNPAPYSAYLRFGDLEIACSSPECFLRIDREGRVESRPIKGTLPRGATLAEDEKLRHQLATDPRFRAENLMITDLVRNDLGRVATPGSVQVPSLMEVDSCC